MDFPVIGIIVVSECIIFGMIGYHIGKRKSTQALT